MTAKDSQTRLPLLDEQVIQTLQDALGDGLTIVLREFMKVTPERLRELRAAGERHDYPGMAKLLHTLKGSSANLGLTVFSERCRILELQANSGHMLGPEHYVDELIREYERVKPHLEKLLESDP